MITSRPPLAKVLRSLDKFWQWLRTVMAPEVGLKLQVECPTCKETEELLREVSGLSDLQGKIYRLCPGLCRPGRNYRGHL